MPSSLERLPELAAFLKGEDARWAALGIAEDRLLGLSDREGLGGLLYQRLSASSHSEEWPLRLRGALSVQARTEAAKELLRGVETRAVLDALACAGIGSILLKGTPLAYGVYDSPASRPRSDTDLLIQAAEVEAARRTMATLGYRTTLHCSDLFFQFEVQKNDDFGVLHVFDFHWRVSAQPAFADVLTYQELRGRAQPLPALGPHALTAGPVESLLLACVHPVMHHRNEERVLWIYDIHLLASNLSPGDFDAFVEMALVKKMAMISAHGLQLAQKVFKTAVPASVIAQLSAPRSEPSAEYLADDRRWHDELMSSVRGLPTLSGRLRLLREVLFPSPQYMLGAYGLRGKPLGSLLLPALYLYRNLFGVFKIVSGKK